MKITKDVLYQMKLCNKEFVDLKNSAICEDGEIRIALDKEKIPEVILGNDDISDSLFYLQNVKHLKESKIYIQFSLGLNDIGFLVISNPVKSYRYELFFKILEQLRTDNHEYYKEAEQNYNEVKDEITTFIKESVRKALDNLDGEFVSDKIEESVYFQQRINDDGYIYYVLNNYWRKIKDDNIEFVSIENDGKKCVYISLN